MSAKAALLGLTKEAAIGLFEDLAEVTKEAIDRAVAPLEARIKALEEKPARLDYRGTFQRSQTYFRHQGVTHHGAVWVCITDRISGKAPHEDPQSWQLAAKSGTDPR